MSAMRQHFEREEFEKALPLCTKSFAFERAYCLYRLNRFQEALSVLSEGSPGEEDRRKRLEAQVRYRMGDYDACAEMYESLYEEAPEDVGLLVNAMASRVSGDRAREAIKLASEAEALLESSYELCFNLACAHIEEGRLADAEVRLQEAENICVAELLQADELAESDAALLEDHEELAAIHVQRGLLLQRRGTPEAKAQASDLYNRVLKHRTGKAGEVDITVLAVACNNVVSLRSEGKSLFDSLKRINMASKESLEHKLTRKQTIEISINKCLLLMQAHKMEEAKRELHRLREAYPSHPRVAIVQAAIAYREKKAKGCEEALQAYLAEHPGSEEVLLCLAQLQEQQHRHEKAAEALAQLPRSSRVQPRTLESIVALHRRQKSNDKAVACLREAIEYWTGPDGNEDEETLASVLRIAARLAMQLKDKVFAAEAFQLYLEKVDGSDVEALCGLVQALASTDSEKAEQYAQRLRVPDYAHLDPEELELAPIPKVAATTMPKRKEKAGGSAEDTEQDGPEAKDKKKRKRKKKIRYPKNFDPANPGPPPDPERWLPKRERAEFKKKIRKRDKNLARGPQGSMPVDDTAFRKQGPSTAQVEVAKDSSTGRPRNQGRKKQGKK